MPGHLNRNIFSESTFKKVVEYVNTTHEKSAKLCTPMHCFTKSQGPLPSVPPAYFVQGLSCPLSRVCRVQGLSCSGFCLSRVCRCFKLVFLYIRYRYILCHFLAFGSSHTHLQYTVYKKLGQFERSVIILV
jgi:hypothetical protein